MTPAELAFNIPSSLCRSEFGVSLDSLECALLTERANGDATDTVGGLVGVIELTGTYTSSRLAKSSSSNQG